MIRLRECRGSKVNLSLQTFALLALLKVLLSALGDNNVRSREECFNLQLHRDWLRCFVGGYLVDTTREALGTILWLMKVLRLAVESSRLGGSLVRNVVRVAPEWRTDTHETINVSSFAC